MVPSANKTKANVLKKKYDETSEHLFGKTCLTAQTCERYGHLLEVRKMWTSVVAGRGEAHTTKLQT